MSSSESYAVTADTRALLLRARDGSYRVATGDEVIAQALNILAGRVRTGCSFNSPAAVKDYLRLKIGALEHEVFSVLFLNSQHELIELREMFRGTLSQTSVYPREVVKAALALNAGAVVLAHNHPSNQGEPSRADELLTQTLKSKWQAWHFHLNDKESVMRSMGC